MPDDPSITSMTPASADFVAVAADDARLAPGATDAATARRRVLEAAPGSQDERVVEYRARLLDALDRAGDAALARSTRPGHLTGSAFVIRPEDGHALLLFHTKLRRWLQPGGHADGQADLAAVALREATEETGLTGLRVVLPALDVDVHRVDPPAEDPHDHLDLRFLVLAPEGSVATPNHESTGHRWIAPTELAGLIDPADTGLLRLAQRAAMVAGLLGVRSAGGAAPTPDPGESGV